MSRKRKNKELEKQKIKKSKLIIAIVVVFLCIASIYWAKLLLRDKHEMTKSLVLRAIGNLDADIRIIEHVDFQCSACAKGYLILKKYYKEYPEKIQIELRYHPWTQQKNALNSALYAECSASQGKFWEYTQLLFERQNNWKHAEDAGRIFQKLAKEVSLDRRKLIECVANEQTKKIVLGEKEQGAARGIKRTPSYYINGKMVVGIKSLKFELNRLLRKYEN